MIHLYDDSIARRFEPFAATRPLGEMRVGALLVRERWERVLGLGSQGFVSGVHLKGFAEFDAPAFASGELPAGSWLVNTRAVPSLVHAGSLPDSPDSAVLFIDDAVAAVRLTKSIAVSRLETGRIALEEIVAEQHTAQNGAALGNAAASLSGHWLTAVWDIVGTLVDQLQSDLPVLASQLALKAFDASTHSMTGCTGTYEVFVEDGAKVEPFVMFDTSAGPIVVRSGSVVQSFTRVVGPCYIGHDSTVSVDRIAACSIGDVCRVHGELSCTVIIGHSNKGHDGFVGHSMLGRWVNLGAGTITSNLKNTYGKVSLWTPEGVVDTNQQFLGTLFGDHAKTGIGLMIATGTVIGAGASIFDLMPPKMVPPFSWGDGAPYSVYEVERFLVTASRMMSRRHVELDEQAKEWWRRIHSALT